VIDHLKETARAHPGQTAVHAPDRNWAYAELYSAAERMARRLWPLGAQPGEVVALVAHPDALAIQALHAVPRTGAVMAPLNPKLGQAAMEEALDALGPSVIVTSGNASDEAGLNPSWVTRLDELPQSDPDLPGFGTGAGYRLWTSGSSGEPKVVDVPLEQLDASASAVAKRLELTPDDCWYASLSPAHIGGLALVHRAAAVGCALATTGPFDVGALSTFIDEGRITHASLVPTQLHRLLELREERVLPPGLRCLLVGGAGTPEDLLDRALAAQMPIALTYGLTEATSQVATAPPEMVAEAPGTVGFPLDGLEVRLAADGEISVRGDTVVPASVDEDGWLATGDLARTDDLGRLWITGRKSARIISGGVNVDPARVEDVLRSIPGVADAVVVGIADEVWGERVVAVVTATEPGPLEPALVVSAATEMLAQAERPRQIRVLERFPLNANGKVDRRAVVELISRVPGR
jgi:o-succinylbenzoate---CoA ligase